MSSRAVPCALYFRAFKEAAVLAWFAVRRLQNRFHFTVPFKRNGNGNGNGKVAFTRFEMVRSVLALDQPFVCSIVSFLAKKAYR